eukprot:CAMPEP_0194577850 /NCGR_PEP_ID=MMETSP0292-20121207/12477_1 /TAXON_ID=39354 /ORGANISM="Heterosigma akashiwo, Strain CCMP2393" /LENGTH=175 /DNA_ID=CAMNT_0039430335 /DNA_START=181 /DNA_END=708 /DNA_ORIENTATION=+
MMMKSQGVSRRDMIKQVAASSVLASASSFAGLSSPALAEDFTTKSGLKVNIIKKGSGEQAKIGDLVEIRFKGSYNGITFDDIFDKPNGYFTRVGGGSLLPGVEEALPMMRVGDRWALKIPAKLGFGPNGRPASPGKPRIPGTAELDFELELTGLPGKEIEIIDLQDDFDEDAPLL